MFAELLRKLADRGKVVLLIDEYDKPIIDYLDDIEHLSAVSVLFQTGYLTIKARRDFGLYQTAGNPAKPLA